MSRELLFRGKDKKSGEWVVGRGVDVNWKDAYIIVPQADGTVGWFGVEEVEVEPKTVCQYTGLTDKNGTKIFEGDIVEFLYKNQRDIRSVIWYDSFMSYELATNGKVDMHDGWDFTDCCYSGVVVGNIFDNKELVE